MPIKLENIGIAVRDLEEAIAFFTDLGLTVLGRATVSGEWADTAVGLDGNHAHIALLQTPDGNGRLELFEYIHPHAIETGPTQPNQIGMHRVAFSVDDIEKALEIAAAHGCYPLRDVATYEDAYKLTTPRQIRMTAGLCHCGPRVSRSPASRRGTSQGSPATKCLEAGGLRSGGHALWSSGSPSPGGSSSA